MSADECWSSLFLCININLKLNIKGLYYGCFSLKVQHDLVGIALLNHAGYPYGVLFFMKLNGIHFGRSKNIIKRILVVSMFALFFITGSTHG